MSIESIPVVGQLGPRAASLVKLLAAGKVGDTLTDEQLATACGQPVTPGSNGYASLQSAIRYVRVNHAMEWKRVLKANAIKCLNASETLVVGQSDLRQIRRRTKRSLQKLGTVKLKDLPQEERHTHTILSAQLGALHLCADVGTTKKLAARVEEITNPDATRVLEMFRK